MIFLLNGYNTEEFHVSGTSFRENEIESIGIENYEFDYSRKDFVEIFSIKPGCRLLIVIVTSVIIIIFRTLQQRRHNYFSYKNQQPAACKTKQQIKPGVVFHIRDNEDERRKTPGQRQAPLL